MGGNGLYPAPVVTRMETRREMLAAVQDRYRVVDAVLRPPFCFVRVRFTDGDGLSYEGCGFAKQNRYGRMADPWNGRTGREIAVGRAIHDLLDALESARSLRVYGPAYAMEA
jgi:hypothetical protein